MFKSSLWIVRAAGAGIGAVALIEIGLRVLGFGHPLLYRAVQSGYELVPSQVEARMGRETHINALGTRGPEATALPVSGVTRILSLGDSVANGGTQINDDQTYPLRLQRALGDKVEVLNAAAGGWALENERAWLREHGSLGASTIVLEINEKDLDQQFVDGSIVNAVPTFPSHYPSTAIGDVIGRYVLPKLGIGKPAVDPGSTSGAADAKSEAMALSAVTEIAEIAKNGNARLVILYWDPHYGACATQTAAARENLFAWARSQGIQIVRPNLSARPDWKSFFRDRMHPNAAANGIIAQQLAAAIR